MLIMWMDDYSLAPLAPLDPGLIIDSPGDCHEERGRAALAGLLDAKATAAFCYNDLTAIGLVSVCHAQGVGVPEDFSIVGYDGLGMGCYKHPALTTVQQPRVELGESAMRMAIA